MYYQFCFCHQRTCICFKFDRITSILIIYLGQVRNNSITAEIGISQFLYLHVIHLISKLVKFGGNRFFLYIQHNFNMSLILLHRFYILLYKSSYVWVSIFPNPFSFERFWIFIVLSFVCIIRFCLLFWLLVPHFGIDTFWIQKLFMSNNSIKNKNKWSPGMLFSDIHIYECVLFLTKNNFSLPSSFGYFTILNNQNAIGVCNCWQSVGHFILLAWIRINMN